MKSKGVYIEVGKFDDNSGPKHVVSTFQFGGEEDPKPSIVIGSDMDRMDGSVIKQDDWEDLKRAIELAFSQMDQQRIV